MLVFFYIFFQSLSVLLALKKSEYLPQFCVKQADIHVPPDGEYMDRIIGHKASESVTFLGEPQKIMQPPGPFPLFFSKIQ